MCCNTLPVDCPPEFVPTARFAPQGGLLAKQELLLLRPAPPPLLTPEQFAAATAAGFSPSHTSHVYNVLGTVSQVGGKPQVMETPVSCERDDPDTLTPAEPLQLQSPILEEVVGGGRIGNQNVSPFRHIGHKNAGRKRLLCMHARAQIGRRPRVQPC